MRIAINCRSFLKKQYAGIGRYTYNLVQSLAEIDKQNQYFLYAKKGLFDFKKSLPKPPAQNFSLKWDFLNRGLQKTLKKMDIYHAPSLENMDIHGPRIIVTVHDLVYKKFPAGHTAETIETTRKQLHQITRRADHIICCSQSTKEDLLESFDFPESHVTVIHQGVDRSVFYPLCDEERNKAAEDLKQWGIEQPFLFFVGTSEPRKNLENTLRAFALLKSDQQFSGKLVIAGMKGWMKESNEELAKRLNLKDDIVYCGYISDSTLRALYNLCEVFVFPSFYEGFGFPILEAFCCGAPVVTSNSSSCAEVAGDAAVLVDSYDPGKIAQAIEEIIKDDGRRDLLSRKGFKRSRNFSFLKTAQETFKVYSATFNR